MKKTYFKYIKFIHSAKNLKLTLLFFSFLGLFIFLAMVVVSNYDETQRQDKQFSILEDDVNKQKQKYLELLPVKQLSETDYYIEREARNVLGYSFADEFIYIPKRNTQVLGVQTTEPVPVLVKPAEHKSESMLDKWLKLIFG